MLKERLTVEEAEAANPGITDDRLRHWPELGRPFGGINAEWERLKQRMRPGDELWTFRTNEASWSALAGSAGIALVRDGDIVTTIVTMRN